MNVNHDTSLDSMTTDVGDLAAWLPQMNEIASLNLTRSVHA